MSFLLKTFFYLFLGLIFSLLLFPFPTNGQQPYFKNYQIRDGLSSNNVYYVFQDSKGFIWFGTDSGILKFDGQYFEKMTTQDGLSDNDIFGFFEDSKGRLWTLNYNGKPSFIKDEKIYSDKNLSFLKDIQLPRYICAIGENETGEIYILSASKTYLILDLEKETASMHDIPEESKILGGWSQPDKKVGYVSDETIGILNDSSFHIDLSVSLTTKLTKAFIHHDSMFFSNAESVYLYNSSTKEIEKKYEISHIPTEVISLFFHEKKLWAGTRKGVYITDENDEFQSVPFSFLNDYAVASILKDREGGMWFTTLDAGIFYLPSPDILQYRLQDGVPGYRISALKKDFQNNLWIGGYDNQYSILSMDGKMEKKRIPNLFNRTHAIIEFRQNKSNTMLVNGKMYSMFLQGQDTLYSVFSSTSGLFDKEGNYWCGLNQLILLPKEDLSNWLFSLEELKPTLPPNNQIREYKHEKIIATKTIYSLTVDKDNRIWAGGPEGLFRYEKSRDTGFFEFPKAVIPHQINYLKYHSKRNILIVGTATEGLYFIQDTSIIHQLPIIENNRNVYINRFTYDENDNLWVGGLNGLYKVNSDWKIVKNYSSISGIGEEKINAVEVVGNHIYIGKDYGLMKIPLEVLDRKIEVSPPIFLNEMKVNMETIELGKNLQLDYFQNSISFSFKGLSFKDYGKILYKFRLLGQNEKWDSTYSNTTFYNALDPGDYTFEVKSISGQGMESTEPIRIHFFIKKPFWKTIWFLLLTPFTLASFLFFYVKQREKKLKKRYEQKQQLIQAENEKLEINQKFQNLKMHALRLQMNPHFIFNSLNTIKGYYGAEDIKTANDYIKKFAKLLRINLEYSDEYIPLNKEIEVLRFYAELSQLRYPDKFDLEIFVDKKIQTLEIVIPPMLIQPFVENAIIHGLIPKKEKGTLQISFFLEKKILKVIVKDDGIGRKASAKINRNEDHKSLAINITRDRLSMESNQQLKNGVIIEDLENEVQKSIGTKTTLLIPIKKVW